MAGHTILTTPVSGPAAWIESDLAGSRNWEVRLDPDELAEIESALTVARASGRDLHALGREEFPLPRVGPRLQGLLHELEHGRGFVQLKGLPVARWTERDAAIVYWGIGTHLGRALSQNARGELLGHVRDEGLDIRRPDVRAYQTRVAQGFHTDIGGDVLGLMCLQTARWGGASRIVSSISVYNALLERHPWYVGLLYRDLAVDWRGEEPPGAEPFYREPVYAWHEGRLSCRFAPRLIRSAQAKGGGRLCAAELEAIGLVERLADELALDIDFEPGDIQLLNNYTILHGRAAYEDHPRPERRRHLLRLWLNVPGARRLPPEYDGGRARSGVPARGYRTRGGCGARVSPGEGATGR